jgi:hypothetical protein
MLKWYQEAASHRFSIHPMKNTYSKSCYLVLAGLTLLAPRRAAAQKVAPAAPVQTIALSATAALGGAVQIANGRTVLFLTDTKTSNVHAQCLDADGRTAWETDLTRYQHATDDSRFHFSASAKTQAEVAKQALAVPLLPVDVISTGNDIYTVERLQEEALKKLRKGSGLKPNQVFVQHLNEQGQLTKALFDPRPEPETNKILRQQLTRYGEGNEYIEVIRETNAREETAVFYLDHYDLTTKAFRREPLALPPAPKQPGKLSMFQWFYQDWAWLGHRPGQSYFCRRTLVNGPNEKAGNQPLTYQVYITDNRGAATGGFATNLELAKKTATRFSGYLPNLGDMNHLPDYHNLPNARPNDYRSNTVDGWAMTTGNTGDFYLEPATGNVVIFGEYGEGDEALASFTPRARGLLSAPLLAAGTGAGAVADGLLPRAAQGQGR